MRKVYCDCCKREIQSVEQIFGMVLTKGHIESGRTVEVVCDDMCVDCYERIMHIIDNAESWRMRT